MPKETAHLFPGDPEVVGGDGTMARVLRNLRL